MYYMLHEPKKLLLHEYLLLNNKLLVLELVLSSLELCKCSSCLLSLSVLVLPHPLKYSQKSEVSLRGRWR